jgi:excisionase family DNA binding protein
MIKMDEQILNEVLELKKLIAEQNMLNKEVLNFNEAAIYLDVSHSHLYKLAGNGAIPSYKPNGKKLYFNRHEIDEWLMSKKQFSVDEIKEKASNFTLKPGRR